MMKSVSRAPQSMFCTDDNGCTVLLFYYYLLYSSSFLTLWLVTTGRATDRRQKVGKDHSMPMGTLSINIVMSVSLCCHSSGMKKVYKYGSVSLCCHSSGMKKYINMDQSPLCCHSSGMKKSI